MRDRVRILVPPGIGDIYWVLVKLRGFLKAEGITARPELTAVSYEHPEGIHLRGVPYLKLFDWFDVGEPATVPNDPALQPIWDEAYGGIDGKHGRAIFADVMGFDYFMAYNGRVNCGAFIEDDDIPCEWDIHTFDLAPRAAQWRETIGRYVVHFWPFYGSYESHLREFPIARILEGIGTLRDVKHIFIGSSFERALNPKVFDMMAELPGMHVDLIGQTQLLDTLNLMAGAELVVGYHAGITNLAAALRMKTVLLWDQRYPLSTMYAVVPPGARGTNYRALLTAGLSSRAFADAMHGVLV